MKKEKIIKNNSDGMLNNNLASEETYDELISRIIHEYKEQNNLDIITKEEITDLFGESSIDGPSYYQSEYGSIFAITDYECYMLRKGINIIEWTFYDFPANFNQTEDGYDLGDAETVCIGEYESEINDELEFEGIETGNEPSTFSKQENSKSDSENSTSNANNDLLIEEFQKFIIESIQSIFSDAHELTHVLFLLTNTGAREFFIFSNEQWRNQLWVKRTIYELCQREETIAFMLIVSSNENRVVFLLSSERIQDIFIYRVNKLKHTLEFIDRGSYNGDYTGYFKNKVVLKPNKPPTYNFNRGSHYN